MKQPIKSCAIESKGYNTLHVGIDSNDWMTSKEAAKYLGISVKALHNLNSLGRIPYFKLGSRNRYLRNELESLIITNPKGTRSHVNQTAHGRKI